MSHKYVPSNVRSVLLYLILMLCLILTLISCGGQAEDASKARSRAVINAGAIVPASEVRVSEYLNYYEQQLPEPVNETIGLNTRLGNPRMPAEGGAAWLQIGLQAKSEASDYVAPLNIALVIDRSGSMSDADKMPYVKQALGTFLQSLNPNDIVSVIAYSDFAELLLPAQEVGNGRWIESVINNIQPGGSTNLHAGMIAGFQEVDKNFDIRRNNRVILLTDGIANRGITFPDQIATDAKYYNDKDIYLSTIGLGLELDDALLSQLAHQGNGGYSFVDSAQEIERVFIQQVAGLKQRAADNIQLSILPEPGVRLIRLTGTEESIPPSGVTIPLTPLGTDESKLLLAQFQVEWRASNSLNRPLAQIKLTYEDEFSQRVVTAEQIVSVDSVVGLRQYDPLWDIELLRNVTIQDSAETLQQIDQLFQSGRYEKAWRASNLMEARIRHIAQITQDSQLYEDAELMRRYQVTLADALWQAEGRYPTNAEGVGSWDGDGDGEMKGERPLPTVEIR